MENTDRDPGFRERLAKVIGQQEPYPWAASLGIGKSTFAGPWSKGAMPQTKTLLKIAQHTDISLNWLLTGKGPERLEGCATGRERKAYLSYMGVEGRPGGLESIRGECAEVVSGTPVKEMGESYRVPQEEYCLVPRYGVQVSSGQLLHSEQVVDYLSFKVSWIEQTMGLDSRALALIHVLGDSMEPTLKEGDLLLLDRRGYMPSGAGRTARSDAIYVLLRGEELVVKRLQFGFDGSVTVQSDNPIYATQLIPAEKSPGVQVVGRVVWVGRKV
ncbi:MAG: helix-turn-helix domain-containing protein [Magnetococcus sp. YQC-3]